MTGFVHVWRHTLLGLLSLVAAACAQRPKVVGSPCGCPWDGYICVEGLCQPNTLSTACQGSTMASPQARHFPLFPSQYRNALSRLSGMPITDIDTPVPGFERGPTFATDLGWQVGEPQLDVYRQNASIAADYVIATKFATGDCAAQPGATDCVLRFAEEAYRRPLQEREAAALRDLLMKAAAEFGELKAIKLALSAILQSPKFLYRSELGPLPSQAGETKITPSEAASALAFLLTDEPPDDDLLAAARNHSLMESHVRLAQAKRLLLLPSARSKIQRFFFEWLDLNHLSRDVRHEEEGFSDLVASMHEETASFLQHHVGRPSSGFPQLFTEQGSFVDKRLAEHYGVTSFVEGVASQVIDIPGRKGLLANGSFLVAHPNPPERLPITRGLVIVNALQCDPLPPPPAETSILLGNRNEQGGTARDRHRYVMQNDSCASCHGIFGELSLGLEQFDAMGRLRSSDQGQPLDTHVVVPNLGTFDDTLELAAAVAESEDGQRCFVKHVLKFALEWDPTGAGASNECLAEKIHLRWKARGLHVPALFEEIVQDEVFVSRWFEP